MVDENETSLSCVKQRIRARPGMNGKGKAMHGPRGSDLVVRVPKGTVVREIPGPQRAPRHKADRGGASEPGRAGDGGGVHDGGMGFLDALEEQLSQEARAREQDRDSLFVHYPRWEDRNDLSRVPLPAEFRA
ncbi:hypothetical protein LPJ61_006029, partial [Coemansia biformis]